MFSPQFLGPCNVGSLLDSRICKPVTCRTTGAWGFPQPLLPFVLVWKLPWPGSAPRSGPDHLVCNQFPHLLSEGRRKDYGEKQMSAFIWRLNNGPQKYLLSLVVMADAVVASCTISLCFCFSPQILTVMICREKGMNTEFMHLAHRNWICCVPRTVLRITATKRKKTVLTSRCLEVCMWAPWGVILIVMHKVLWEHRRGVLSDGLMWLEQATWWGNA